MIMDLRRATAYALVTEPLIFLIALLVNVPLGWSRRAVELVIVTGALLIFGYLLLHFSVTNWLVNAMIGLFTAFIGLLLGMCSKTWFATKSKKPETQK